MRHTPQSSSRVSPGFPCIILAMVTGLLTLSVLAGCSGDDVRANLQILQEKRQLIASIRVNLLLAVDAGKNALLSPVETDAKNFLTKAGQAMATSQKQMIRLTGLIEQGKNTKEAEAVSAVTADFMELQAIDGTLADLAGRNTNLRAAALSRTEAAVAISRLQQALTPIIDAPFCPASREALRVIAAGLSILSLHTQHIDESTDTGMDSLEAAMRRQDERAHEAFTQLSGLLPPTNADQLAQATAAYADFWRVTQEVLRLSRQNTNLEAEALSMGRKRLLTAKTLDDLAALDAVVAEKEFAATR